MYYSRLNDILFSKYLSNNEQLIEISEILLA